MNKLLGKDVTVTAPGKLLLLLVVMIACTAIIIVSMLTHEGDTTPAWTLLGAVTTYLVANGAGAKKGLVSIPPLSASPEKQKEVIQKEIEKIEKQAAHDD